MDGLLLMYTILHNVNLLCRSLQKSSNNEQADSEAEDALNPLETLAEAVASQPVAFRNYKGQSRQMITMTFLEEGGFFDMPIQVGTDVMLFTLLCNAHLVLHTLMCNAHLILHTL